ncbi:MAG: hypothetical protein JWP01_3024 [Myxococcales bacterium]|nr:hypothetical protein [Myxococcales bacterium]
MLARVRKQLLASHSAADAGRLLEAALVIVVTWVLLGWLFNRTITQADGTWLVVPYTDSALHAGRDWTDHLYRFGVVGGSEMHPFAGTTPLLQLCSVLGLSTTTTVNVSTLFLQLCFGFFGMQLARAVAIAWSGDHARSPSRLQRIVATWLCAFAPVLGWRLALGHENLLLGLVPLLTAVSLLWCARAGTLSVTVLAFAAFAVSNGVSGLGPQSLVYSAVFGAPLLVATILGAPAGERWRRPQWIVVGVLAGAVLVMLPRLAGMIAHALGSDATRSLHETVTYSAGVATAGDWLASIPWTAAGQTGASVHEQNFPIGPLIALLIVGWPRGVARSLRWTAIATTTVAVLFACNVAPVSTALLELVPPLGAFRVPARAVLPILIFVPSFALATCWFHVRTATPPSRRVDAGVLVVAAIVILVVHGSLPWLREVIAWLGCLAIAFAIRWRPAILERRPGLVPVALVMVAALGVLAFDERFPRTVPFDRIEHGPAELRTAVRTAAPALTTALDRIQILDAPPPYEMSTAFAARLPSLDGIWYPSRRFLDLLSAIQGEPLPATTAVFAFGKSPTFRILQQLYNVRLRFTGLGTDHPSLDPLPRTPGAAWFPARIEVIDRPAQMVDALRGPDLRTTLATTAWVLRSELAASTPASCTGARVFGLATDELGQTATITTYATEPCTLVLATSYVAALRATAISAGRASAVPTLPIDLALTGIIVPAGLSTIVLSPVAWIPWWSRIAQLLGLALLVAGLAAFARRQGRGPS